MKENLKSEKCNNLRLQSSSDIRAKSIAEQTPSNSDIENLKNGQRLEAVIKRYEHEKNKILFMISTFRGLRSRSKEDCFQPIARHLMSACVVLVRKCYAMTDYNLSSINQSNNIFELSGFLEFLKTSKKKRLTDMFEKEKNLLVNYLNHLKDVSPHSSDKAYIDAIFLRIKDVLLIQLDAMLLQELKSIKDNLHHFEHEQKHKLIVSLAALFYSIRCEETFRYQKGSDSFDWNSFFTTIDNKSDQELLDIIRHANDE